MSNGIDIKGLDNVLANFELQDTPFYAVYSGKDLKFQSLSDNIDEAAKLLRDNLETIAQHGSVAVYKIEYYLCLSEKGKLVKENVKGSINFRLTELGMPSNMYYSQQNQGLQPINTTRALADKVEALEDKLDKIADLLLLQTQQKQIGNIDEEEEEEEEEETPAKMFFGFVNTLLQKPEVMQAISGKIVGFIDKVIPTREPQQNFKHNSMDMQPTERARMNGVVTEESVQKIQQAIEILINHTENLGGDLMILADLAKDEPETFKKLLLMLRNKTKMQMLKTFL